MKNPQNIIITGASSGIGHTLAQIYAQKGVNLLLLGRDENRLLNCRNDCINQGANVIDKICDVRDYNQISKILLEFDQNYPVDLIIANAGISAGTSGQGESYQQLKDIFDTNIYGVMNSIYPLINMFKQRQSGQIAIISSIASFRGLPSAPAYSASKACVRYIGEALRGELMKDNIKVNVICPGYIKTPLTSKNNFPMPFLMEKEVAAKYIKKKLAHNQRVIIFPKLLYYIMKGLCLLPHPISDMIFAGLPKK